MSENRKNKENSPVAIQEQKFLDLLVTFSYNKVVGERTGTNRR